jgi:hypothetical protein
VARYRLQRRATSCVWAISSPTPASSPRSKAASSRSKANWPWRAAREAEGCTRLADVEPARTINGQVRAVVLYTRAVRCAAGAELSETHRDVTATTHGQTRIDDDRLTAGDTAACAPRPCATCSAPPASRSTCCKQGAPMSMIPRMLPPKERR